ncbi:MAG: 2-aminophenol 1,6-dioxygenase alpha subunit [Firmicutes bacterium ADurb.Bin182]|nr:MAG: 2-aminophenol 1,6-dioxygenase alpha subunit [Firmicutes bacterium ADurb.Bin182]
MNRTPYVAAGFLLPHPPVIVLQVGKGQELKALGTIKAMEQISEQVENLRPETVVLISPHAPLFRDYVFIYMSKELKGNLHQFGANINKAFKQDDELRNRIEQSLIEKRIPAGFAEYADQPLDHGAIVSLVYLSAKYDGFRLVVLSPSGMDADTLRRIGQTISEAAASLKRRIIIVASGDLSHKVNRESPYGSCPEGGEFDKAVVESFSKGDLRQLLTINDDLIEKAAECGYKPLSILCGAFDLASVKTKVFSYEAPFGIGYCIAAVYPPGNKESIHVKIARETLEAYVKNRNVLTLETINPDIDHSLLDRAAGVFVSLKISGRLRGCIGTIFPVTKCIAEEIIHNAIAAGTQDPRFAPVTEEELDRLTYSVDVLSTPVPAVTDELDPKVFGVIVEKGWRKGLLLPDLEGVDTIGEQLRIACLKAGIDPNGKYDIKKFTVTRYE